MRSPLELELESHLEEEEDHAQLGELGRRRHVAHLHHTVRTAAGWAVGGRFARSGGPSLRRVFAGRVGAGGSGSSVRAQGVQAEERTRPRPEGPMTMPAKRKPSTGESCSMFITGGTWLGCEVRVRVGARV